MCSAGEGSDNQEIAKCPCVHDVMLSLREESPLGKETTAKGKRRTALSVSCFSRGDMGARA